WTRRMCPHQPRSRAAPESSPASAADGLMSRTSTNTGRRSRGPTPSPSRFRAVTSCRNAREKGAAGAVRGRADPEIAKRNPSLIGRGFWGISGSGSLGGERHLVLGRAWAAQPLTLWRLDRALGRELHIGTR